MNVLELRIKKLEKCKDLLTLRSWVWLNLNKDEEIIFHLEETCDERYKVIVKKDNENFIVQLGDMLLGKYSKNELFMDFLLILVEDSLKDISIFGLRLIKRG